MAKDTFYFSHDYNARNDSKIKKLLSKHGYPGYGMFWAIIEDLYNNANALPTDYDSIAFDLRTTPDVIKSLINDFDLFVIDANHFGSLSVERRLNERNDKSVKARESARNRWNKIKDDANALKSDANALQPQSECNAIKESIVKESKGNESKEKIVVHSDTVNAFILTEEKKEAFTAIPINADVVKKEKPAHAEVWPTFEDLWIAYDKRVGSKPKLKLKFNALPQIEKEKIMQHVPDYVASTPDKVYRKHLSTFLNQSSWNDEIIKPKIYQNEQQRKQEQSIAAFNLYKQSEQH